MSDHDERDADGNLASLRPVELLDRNAIDRDHARRVLGELGPYTPEVDDGMVDEHLRRLVGRANVLVADQLAGRRAVPDAESHERLGRRVLEEDERLGRRAGELDAILGDCEIRGDHEEGNEK